MTETSKPEKLPPEIANLAATPPDSAAVSVPLRSMLDGLGNSISRIDAAANTGNMDAVRLTVRMAALHHDLLMAVADGRHDDVERMFEEAKRLAA